MLVVLPYLFMELYFSLAVGEQIGFLWTVIWILGSFMLGMGLIQNAHKSLITNMKLATLGKLNAKSFHDASTSYFIGAILLIIPGVFSDFLGVMALFYTLFLQLGGTISLLKDKSNIKKTTKQGDDDVIDVEIIEHDPYRNTKP